MNPKLSADAANREMVREIAELLRSFDNLEGIYPRIVQIISEFLEVEIVSLMLNEEGELAIRGAQGLAPEIVTGTVLHPGEGIAGWVFREKLPLLVENIEQDERFHRASLERYYTRSLISVPLLAGGDCLGVLNINNKRDRTIFDGPDLAAAVLLADMIALAVKQARTQRELRRRVDELELLYGAVRLFASTLELDQILDAVLARIDRTVPLRRATIFMLDEEREEYRPAAQFDPRSLEGAASGFTPAQLPVPLAGGLFQDRRVQVVRDPAQLKDLGWPALEPALLIPLVVENKAVGIILLYPAAPAAGAVSEHAYPFRLLRFLGDGAALAIKNAGLYQHVHRRMIDLFDANRTMQTQAEQLVELNRYNTSIIEGLTSGFLVLDRAGTIITCNRAAAEILGVACAAVLQRPLAASGVPAAFAEAVGKLQAEGREALGQDVLIDRPGSENPVWLGLSLTPFARGAILRFRDMTQLKNLQQQLIWSEKLASIGQLSAGVAHELNNPLASISGYLQLLQQEPLSPRQRDYLRIVFEELRRMGEVVNNLLDFSRRGDEKTPLVNLAELVAKTLALLRPQAEKMQVALRATVAGEQHLVTGNLAQLRSLLLNLVLNALQAGPPAGSEVTVAVFSEPGRAGVRVRDQGCGIPPGDLRKIFEPFYTRGKAGGTGLGLAIARKIVEDHRGAIAVTSEVGAGTEFTVSFPLTGAGDER